MKPSQEIISLRKGNLRAHCQHLVCSWHLMYQLLRDLYYKDVALFGKQSVVDRCVDDIARTFRLPRASLNVVVFESVQD